MAQEGGALRDRSVVQAQSKRGSAQPHRARKVTCPRASCCPRVTAHGVPSGIVEHYLAASSPSGKQPHLTQCPSGGASLTKPHATGHAKVGMCSGELPSVVSLPLASSPRVLGGMQAVRIILAGCAFRADGVGHLVLLVTPPGSYNTSIVTAPGGKQRKPLYYHKYSQAVDPLPVRLILHVANQVCRSLIMLRRAVRAECPPLWEVTGSQPAQLQMLLGSQPGSESAPSPTSLMTIHLTWRAIGQSNLQCQARQRSAWRHRSGGCHAVQCARKLAKGGIRTQHHVCTRPEHTCAMLRAVASSSEVHCETRVFLPTSSRELSAMVQHQDFDKGVYQLVCFVYARMSGAPFLALTDIDEHPPKRLPAALARSSEAGARFFVDADDSCGGSCPSNHSDELQRCWSRRRTPWKPVVRPWKVTDVDTYTSSVLCRPMKSSMARARGACAALSRTRRFDSSSGPIYGATTLAPICRHLLHTHA